MINEDNPGVLDNYNRKHAIIVLQELFRAAKESIYIQCSHFSKDIYENSTTQDLLREAINNDAIKVKILVRDKLAACADFAKEINEKRPETIIFNKSCHTLDFCVVDKKRFRLEKDTDKGSAYVCTFNEKLSSLLESYILAC